MDSLYFQNEIDSSLLKKRSHERDKDLRGAYFRDSTAIIHSYPFRRLKHKTQVFFAPKNDHICTRIEHVMHVASISATICRALDLNGDLAWAIGLGHDLGHTPFGHLGESFLSSIMSKREIGGGAFRHEIYSLRVVDKLTHYGKGLNLTYAVRDGIINHCGEKFEQSIRPDFKVHELEKIVDRDLYPSTWEGCVVRMADKIAYMGRDMEDALQLKIISKDDIPEQVVSTLGYKNSQIINSLVNDLIHTSLESGSIGFSDSIYEALLVLKNFNYQNIYRSEMLRSYHDNFERIIMTLYNYLEKLFDHCQFESELYQKERNLFAIRFYDFISKMQQLYEQRDGNYDWMIVDYIAGMTDAFAIDSVKEIMIPVSFESQFQQLLFDS